LNPYTPNESYQNFPNRMISDWQQAYYAENFPRLVQVKTKYDPGNLFQNTQSIPVAAS
jgi:FAD/FMN-containing dehydrogenase